ncbi:MAG TPA: hypothetical protein PLS69_11670 [Terricaulis sp.]|nr:hypothetical protein [Terricaulis sp.]
MVLITEELTGLSQRTTSVWLENERGEWRVRALVFGPTAIAGKNSEQFWRAARAQRARGNIFNASMLYAAARSALLSSDFFQPRIAQDFHADLRTFEAHELVRGEAPFQWTFDGQTYRVQQANYMGFGNGDVAFVIDHTAPWANHAEADAINRRLIDAFSERNPEWREVFDAVIARAHRPNSTETWGTVYERKGYTRAPPGAPGAETGGSDP